MAGEREFDCDLVIIGAGLTGLSLACWLLELSAQKQQPLPTLHLLEPRKEYHNDRTWCFWDSEHHPFRHLISHRWPHWQVSSGERSVSQSSEQTPYAMLPAGSVYQHALARIESCPGFSLRQGITVEAISDSADGVLISTNAGQWRARAVIDTRPPEATRVDEKLGFWQVFTGYEIHCPGHGYDAGMAKLMDFQPCQEHICFMYLLPLDRDNLLVEWTAFHPGGEWPDCQARLEAWLDERGFEDYTVTRSESGKLPMMPVSPSRQQGRIVRAGVGGGWMRAATGYHFSNCQRNCAELAGQILAAAASGHWHFHPPESRKHWLDWMDRVFLRALRRHPETAPDWFLDLFSATTAEQMARFMNDQPRWGDAVAVAAALPSIPFLRAVMP
ncbi:lycopene cyclase [Marinobacter vulgaris]|uniref:Lycopene cyclase n=1 Tax=Marinobacter vulgaris TaxID=1928331 RepID=A0A2V3ZMI5_9GAMM|nr:lycopene cyclase family protein [Marinobacter vulgaris]PXX92012.1 lycopene cyclase [Marinobacter vulgaris]TSJ70881.1 lycopene cyclase [Marinobacter vulgaris]